MANRNLLPEQRAVLNRIACIMEFHGITPADLTEKSVDTPSCQTEAHNAVPESGPKYRHPSTDETWDGQGQQPDWLKKALTVEGYRVEELRVVPRTN